MKFLLALLAATAFADTGAEKTESQRNPTPIAAVRQSSAPKQGLNFVVGARGLDSLSFNGESLLVSLKGELQPQKSVFVLCSTQFFLFAAARRRIKGPTPST